MVMGFGDVCGSECDLFEFLYRQCRSFRGKKYNMMIRELDIDGVCR